MIQLQILSGKMAGETKIVRHFPFHVGRAAENDLQLEDEGVWDQHFQLELQKSAGFILHSTDGAFTAVNDLPQSQVRLRAGDLISFGTTKIQFWLAAPRQRGLRLREMFVWFLIAGVTAAQVALIYCLLK